MFFSFKSPLDFPFERCWVLDVFSYLNVWMTKISIFPPCERLFTTNVWYNFLLWMLGSWGNWTISFWRFCHVLKYEISMTTWRYKSIGSDNCHFKTCLNIWYQKKEYRKILYNCHLETKWFFKLILSYICVLLSGALVIFALVTRLLSAGVVSLNISLYSSQPKLNRVYRAVAQFE